MTIVAHELKASYAFIERNFFLTRRYWGWETRLPGLFRRGRAVDLAHRCRPGQPRAAPDADGGSDLLELPGGVQLDRRDGVRRALGRDPGVHLHGPVRRWSQLLGSVVYAMAYGLVHTAVIFVALVLFFPQLDFAQANPATAVTFVLLGSFSFVGIGMIAAILPLLYVERGAQMTFVLQSCLLLVSGAYYSVEILPEWMQVPASVAGDVRPRRRAGRAGPRHACLGADVRRLAADRLGHRPDPVRAVGVRAGRALREAHRQAQAGRVA